MRKIYILLILTILFMVGCGDGFTGKANSSSGISGSMARFVVKGDYLYTLNKSEMNIFDVSEPSNPQDISKIHTPFNVETLYSYKDYLYMGASDGVHIYDNSEPTQPSYLSQFTHAQSCDPVILKDDIAYVTLNSSRNCFRNITLDVNRLEILDMRNPKKPKLIKRIEMWEPKGLAIENNRLFICDGDDGLKVFDINKSLNNDSININLKLLTKEKKIDCYDVITDNKGLVVSNKVDIQQFDSSTFPMKFLSKIK